MTDNHNHALEEILAGTVPQARPEFEQALEDQLMLAFQEQTRMKEMKSMSINDVKDKRKRAPRGLPVTLAATFAMILFGGLAAFIASRPQVEAPTFSGAAHNQQDIIGADMAVTATALILQATYQAAEGQFMTSQSQLNALSLQATEQAAAANPDSAMTSIVQTATAVVQQATARASGHLLLEPAALTATAMIQWATQEAVAVFAATAYADSASGQPLPMPSLVPTSTPIGSASADVISQTCPPDKLVVYSAPGAQNPVVASIDPLAADKFQVQGLLTLHETGEDWFFVRFAYEGAETQGWVQADTVRAACEPFTSAVVSGDAVMTLLPPTIVPPESMLVTPTPVTGDAFTLVPTASPVFLPPTVPPLVTATMTATPIPVTLPPQSLSTVQVRVADPETLDQAALAGQQVDVFLVVVIGPNATTVPVARGVTVQAVVEVPQTDGTRVIEAIISPRTAEQAETLQALAQTQMELTLVPVG
jgi:hypothetical protein